MNGHSVKVIDDLKLLVKSALFLLFKWKQHSNAFWLPSICQHLNSTSVRFWPILNRIFIYLPIDFGWAFEIVKEMNRAGLFLKEFKIKFLNLKLVRRWNEVLSSYSHGILWFIQVPDSWKRTRRIITSQGIAVGILVYQVTALSVEIILKIFSASNLRRSTWGSKDALSARNGDLSSRNNQRIYRRTISRSNESNSIFPQ